MGKKRINSEWINQRKTGEKLGKEGGEKTNKKTKNKKLFTKK